MGTSTTSTTVNTNNKHTTNAVDHQIINENTHNKYFEENTKHKYHEGDEFYGAFDDVAGTINTPGAVMRISLGATNLMNLVDQEDLVYLRDNDRRSKHHHKKDRMIALLI